MLPFSRLLPPLGAGALGAMGAALLALALALAGPAQGVTPLGQTFVPNTPTSCAGGPDWEVFNSTASYTVPQNGVLTSWSFDAGPQQTVLTLRVFRPASPGAYTVVADGGPLQTVAASSGLHTFPTRVPVRSGDYIGIHSTAGNCSKPSPTTPYLFRIGNATPVGGTAVYTPNSSELFDVAASLEPDVDGDGYGDETQDACPASALAQTACPAPETKIKGKVHPQAAKTKLELRSSIAGSTFSCTLDKKKAKACRAKVSYRCLAAGRHKLQVVATSPFGIVDPTPAKVKFSLARGRKGC